MNNNTQVVISLRTIITFFIILIGLGVLWLIKDVIISIFLALILALTLEPFVDWLRRKGVNHGVSVISVVAFVLITIVGLASIALTPIIQEITRLAATLPRYLDMIVAIPGLEEYARDIGNAILSQLTNVSTNLISATIGAFAGVLSAVFILVFTIYVLLDFDNIRTSFLELFPKSKQTEIEGGMKRIEKRLGGWLRGQVLLMIIIGTAVYIGLSLLGVEYALALAVIAGLLEIIPYVGPTTAVIPAVIVGFAASPFLGFAVIGLYLLIQQLEGNLIVPKLMEKTVGFNPIIIIVALMIGGKLLGILGAILAIPMAIIVSEILKYFFLNHEDTKS